MNKKYLEINPKVLSKYKQKSKVLLLVALSSTVILLTGCQSKSVENNSIAANTQVESSMSENTQTPVENSSGESTIQFADFSKHQFVFSSGVGAWQTMLNINEDGTFKGEYSDSDMGDTGEGYPDGIVYSSTFEGKFTALEKINDYTYSMTIETIKLEKEVGTEEIIDGIKYIYSEPYGLDGAKEIYIYTPQAPLKELPEGFRSWVGYMDLSDVKDEYLSFYGLYNIETESGFSSYELD